MKKLAILFTALLGCAIASGQDEIWINPDTAYAEADASVEEMVFEKILVEKGASELGYTEVTLLKYVPAGAKFVTNGAFFLMEKMTNTGEVHKH